MELLFTNQKRYFLANGARVRRFLNGKKPVLRVSDQSIRLSSYTKTEVTIPVPISKGHLAAQLWEGKQTSSSSCSSYETPIIFMHGYQDNSSSFDPLIPLIIKENMKVVSVDQPGHGFSSHLAGLGYDFLLDGVTTIQRVMRHFDWSKVTLIGHSFGSVLSFVFAGSYPDKVNKYVPIENLHPVQRDVLTVVENTTKALFQVERKLTDPTATQPSYTEQEIIERTFRGRKGTVLEDGVKILLQRGAIPDPQNPELLKFSHDLKTDIPSLFGRFKYDDSVMIAKNIKCPVCVIKGDPGEDYEPRESFMKMVETIRAANGGNLEFHLIPGSHHVHLNNPMSVAPIISKFLET